MMAGRGREIPKGKLSLIVTAHHPVKETNPTKFLDFHLTFSKALNQNFNTRKVKKRKFALRIEKRAILPVKLETFSSRLHHRSRVLMNVCRLCKSCQCLVCLTCLAGKMSSKTILIGLSIFRCGVEKSVHGRPSWELALYDCSLQNTKDFTAWCKLVSTNGVREAASCHPPVPRHS